MKILTNERGVALVTSMLLTMISLAIVMAALYFITQQTQLSAASKHYRNALEASHGGVEVFVKDVIPKIFNNYSTASAFSGIGMSIPNQGCTATKLSKDTAEWGTCNDTLRPYDPKSAPDATFNLKGLGLQPGFNVYAKVVDTQKGNSDTSPYGESLLIGSAVTGGLAAAGSVTPKHIPAIYRIEVQGERDKNPQEKAQLTVLYAY